MSSAQWRLHCDLPHGAQDRSFLFVGGQRGQARLAGQLDIDRQAVCQPPDLFDQHRVRAGDRLGVDVAVKMVLVPQDAQSLDHQLHRAVRRAQHSAGQKQPFNIIAAVKADGQLRQLTRGEGRAGSVVGAAVDAVAAIVAAHVGVEHLQEGDAPPVRRESVADARRRTAAQCTVPSGAIHPAGGTGYIIFGAVRQDFQFFRKVHRTCLLKKGDMELSFVDVDDVIEVNERFLAKLFKEVLDVDVQLPIQRMTWQEAMDRYGSDKPDTRFGMELVNVTETVKDSEFVVFKGAIENGGTVRGINAKGQGAMPRKKIDKLVAFAKDFGAKGLAYIAIQEDGTVKSSFSKFMTEEEMNNLIAAMNGEAGDLLLFAADKNKVVWDVLGNLRLELAKQMELLDKNQYNFLWVTEFPLLEWSDEQNRYLAMHHPFTMPMEEDLQYIDSEPGRVRAKAYDIVLNGNEIGGGSVRIFQNDVQEKMFEVLGFTKEQAYEQFGFLLDAFKYGVPPHAGLAYGLDRMVMLMAKEDSIRDVMAFPKIKDASCLMTQAPSMADNKQLEELGLKLDAKDVKTEE